MKTNQLFLLASSIMPTSALAQNVTKKDSVQNTKEVKDRNVLLNASSADQARQINIGLPPSLSAPILEDGLPVSYNTWPDMPYFYWLPGNSYGRMGEVNFALHVVNLFNQSGATGSIGAADLVTDTSAYKNFLMSGSYIRPFEVSLSTTINF